MELRWKIQRAVFSYCPFRAYFALIGPPAPIAVVVLPVETSRSASIEGSNSTALPSAVCDRGYHPLEARLQLTRLVKVIERGGLSARIARHQPGVDGSPRLRSMASL